jgi:hypothetical protein
VPGLVDLMSDGSASERERFLACVALTTWAEKAGYETVIACVRDPESAPWYDILIDRKFSVDSTFAQLSLAVSDSDDLAGEKGNRKPRWESGLSPAGRRTSDEPWAMGWTSRWWSTGGAPISPTSCERSPGMPDRRMPYAPLTGARRRRW